MIHLADAVGELLRQRTMRIHYLPGDPERHYTVRAPSLLDQLAQAVEQSSGGAGGHTVPASRLPLDAGALDLWVHITTNVHYLARELHVARRHLPIARVLRGVAAAVVAPEHHQMAVSLQRRAWCGHGNIAPTDCGHCWAHRIEAMLTPDLLDRELRGAACWVCKTERLDPATGTSTIEPTRTALIERDGEQYRVPAIVVRVAELPDTADTLWIYRMCRACGAEGWLDYTTTTDERVPA